jgi:hypothetical protein
MPQNNATPVKSVKPDLTETMDFLVTDARAAPIANEQQRRNAQRLLSTVDRNCAQLQQRVAQQKQLDDITTSLRNGRAYENWDLNFDIAIANAQASPIVNNAQRPVEAVALAAKLISDLRVAHNKSRH